MVWVPDDVWYQAQQKGSKGKGKGQGMWMSYDDMWAMQQMQMGWGQPMKGGGKGAKGWGKASGKSAGKRSSSQVPANLPFKARLNQACQAKFKGEFTKETLEYTTIQDGETYICELVSEKFDHGPYVTDAPGPSKKQAEENVAMQAMKGEFPDQFRSIPKGLQQQAADMTGEKRKACDGGPALGNNDPKSLLNTGITLLAGRPILRTEVVYEVAEVGSSSQATVTISCPELDGVPKDFAGEVVKGKSKTEKKQAEQNAAQQALDAYQTQIDAKMVEHEAKKEERKVVRAAKMAEMAAAREAAGEPEPPKKVLKKK